MRRIVSLFFFVISAPAFLFAQQKSASYTTEAIICYAGSKTEQTKIMLQADVLKKVQSSRLTGENVFTVIPNDVPSAAQFTINFATEIWSALVTTDVPIKIYVNWVSLADGVLGSARPGSYEANFIGAPLRNVAYPIALAERLAGQELNEIDDYEIYISLNKEYSWHYDFDSNPSPNTHDLLSVVLHEIGHGLGLADTFGASGSSGFYGTDGRANVYDYFVVNNEELQLIKQQNFPNYSSALYRELTSHKLFTGSALATIQNNGSKAKLYAPSEFDNGSSISHLDESTFPAGDTNSLMSPQLSREEVIHAVGPISQAMLAQMGYVYAFIQIDTLTDQPDPGVDVTLTGSVKSDSSLLMDKGRLYYSFDDFENSSQVPLIFDENYNFTATIPAPGTRNMVSYYIEVEDVNNIVYRLPALSHLENFEFGYGIITSIEHIPDNNLKAFVYPNPSTGKITLALPESLGISVITIHNINGKIIDRWQSNGMQTTYKRYLPSGYYLLHIQSNAATLVEKVIIK